ncbi:MAG: PatB family C-S lyase [Chloroflexota bacterium]
MPHDFDSVIDRRGTGSIKWKLYGPEVLPLWVADMDFPAPEPIREALFRAVEHGIFGYEFPSKQLRATVAARMDKLYGWSVSPEAVVATPGVIAGFVAAARTACVPGEGIVVQPPVYPPFLSVHESVGLTRRDAPLQCSQEGKTLSYSIDFEAFAAAVRSNGPRTGLFLLCNPHNPTGQIHSPDDLARMAEICMANDVTICSDEIHAELTLGEASHLPLAALDPEIAARTITLVAPSKTFNVPGLFCGFAIIPEQDLRERFKKVVSQMAMHVNNLGLVAAEVAYSGDCDDWLADLRRYLTANRDFLLDFIANHLPGLRTTIPEASYLAWLDSSALVSQGRIEGSPHKFFLHQAGVALNEGAEFGPGGEPFVRLNFACPRSVLAEALTRMKFALDG